MILNIWQKPEIIRKDPVYLTYYLTRDSSFSIGGRGYNNPNTLVGGGQPPLLIGANIRNLFSCLVFNFYGKESFRCGVQPPCQRKNGITTAKGTSPCTSPPSNPLLKLYLETQVQILENSHGETITPEYNARGQFLKDYSSTEVQFDFCQPGI